MTALRTQWFNIICQKKAQFANINKQSEPFVVPLLDHRGYK